MRKLFAYTTVFAALLALAAPTLAQDATEAATETAAASVEPWVCPEGFAGQTLSVYNWSTYVAEDTISNFEAACGVTVTYDVYDSMETLLARMRQGNPGYDIIVPTDYVVTTLIGEELLLPLNLENIPNSANVSATLLNPPYDPENGYTLPYQWGTVGIGYRVDAVEGGVITSWDQFFNHDGPVAWIEDLRVMLGVANILQGNDASATDPAQIEAARDFLIERGGNVVAIAQDDGQALLERGEVDMTVEYSGDIFQVIYECECDDYAYVIPDEGSSIWVDNLAIPTGAPNQPLAEVFIDYILHPQVSADISNYTAYASPNQAAIDAALIDAELLENTSIYPTDELRERLFFVQQDPTSEQLYVEAWDEVKILLGQ